MPATITRIDRLIHAWENGATLQQMADAEGVTRQRISQLLIEAGHAPSARREKRKAEKDEALRPWREQRAAGLAQRARARTEAAARFAALADELGVTATTLGQYAAKSGAYAKDAPPRSLIKLPRRRTPEGDAIAARAIAAASPWAVRHIANLAGRSRPLTGGTDS